MEAVIFPDPVEDVVNDEEGPLALGLLLLDVLLYLLHYFPSFNILLHKLVSLECSQGALYPILILLLNMAFH